MSAIGIDLGTSKICASIIHNGKPSLVMNEYNSSLTPSYVTYDDDEVITGRDAQKMSAMDPSNTVHDIIKLLALEPDKIDLRKEQPNWPFQVTFDKNRVMIHVQQSGRRVPKPAEEIASELLKSVKDAAEEQFGVKVSHAVITVPPFYNQNARETVRRASKLVGMEPLGVITGPMAAAVTYHYHSSSKISQAKIIVFDFGGGSVDVSVMAMTGREIQVMGTASDDTAGGQDVDACLSRFFQNDLMVKNRQDISRNHKAMIRLQTQCNKVKHTLSGIQKETLEVDYITPELPHFQYLVTCAKVEELSTDIFKKAVNTMLKSLKNARMDMQEINQVILVGGSSRIPHFQKLLERQAGKEKMNKSIHPDEAMATGAAIYASYLQQQIPPVMVTDSPPLEDKVQPPKDDKARQLEQKIAELEKQDSINKNKIAKLTQQKSQLELDISNSKQTNSEIQKQNSQLKQDNVNLNQTISDLNNRLNDSNAEVKRLKTEVKRLNSEVKRFKEKCCICNCIIL